MTIIYLLQYTELENPEPIFAYFPTKVSAQEYIANEKKRWLPTKDAITDVEIDRCEIDTSSQGLADLLNTEVGTGF